MRTSIPLVLAAALTAGCPASTTTTPGPATPVAEPAAPAPTPTEPEAEPKAKPVELTEETKLESPAGASFTAPAGWFVTRGQGVLELQPPERDLSLWMVDIENKSAEEAIAEAWKQAVPDFALERDDVAAPPARGGWDEVRQISYKLPAEAARSVVGVARRKGDIAYVVLIDGKVAALQRRGAQIGQIVGSQKPAGLDEESFAGAKAVPLDAERAAALDAFIEKARATMKIPGAAVAVVQGGKVVFEHGYGVRGPKGRKVTPKTRFMIGSTTKSLSSLMAAILIDQGKFEWTTPLTKLLPLFTLADPEIAAKVELQHAFCACTGLPRQDMEFVFEFAGRTPKQRLAELGTMKPTTGFGETFQYSNALVSAGGFAAARAASGKKGLMKAYAQAMKRNVFGPLGMKSTMFDTRQARRGNHAVPYGRNVDGTYAPIPFAYERAVTSVAPAGGAWSTVRDLARYVQLELAGGKLPSGKRILSEAQLSERRNPRVNMDDETTYGLALVVSKSRGLVQVGHGGNTLGFTAGMDFFPEHDFGIVVLANAQVANAFSGAVRRKLIELLLAGRPEADESLTFAAERLKQVTEQEMAKITDPPDAAWVAPLLGVYRNAALGKISVVRKGEKIFVDAGEWKIRAGAYELAGSKTLMLLGPSIAGLPFIPQADGTLLLDVGQQKYVFARTDKGK